MVIVNPIIIYTLPWVRFPNRISIYPVRMRAWKPRLRKYMQI